MNSKYFRKFHKYRIVSVFFNKPGRLSNDFNYESQVRGKRSVPSELTAKADDPQSPEHLKQLEESFPNPASINTFHQPDFNLVRVKRDDH